jgi:heat-inducible transcriptional repressor
MLMRAAKILANLSGCIALVSAPQTHIVTIRHLQLVVVDPQRVMVILVTDSYQTHSLLVNLSSGDAADSQSGQIPPLPISAESLEEELQVLSNFLNLKLRGKTFAQLQDVSWLELDREFRSYAVWLQQLFKGITQKVLKSCSTQLFAAGVNELMRQPEFSQTHQMQAVIQLLEEDPGALEGVISPNPPGQVTIYIGMENPLQPIRHCTLISSTYYRGLDPLGSVSLLGPTRMVYEKAISSVQRVADYLSTTLAS